MVDTPPEFEIADIAGTTTIIQGSVTTTAINVPTVPGAPIDEAIIRIPSRDTSGVLVPSTRRVDVSLDGGLNNIPLFPGDVAVINLSGETQVRLVSNYAPGVPYNVILKRVSP